jgi:hypothetical protein
MKPHEALDSVSFYSNDLNRTVTIRTWLQETLLALWREREDFSGKRPLGNSDWDGDVAVELISRGIISTMDSSGGLIGYDWDSLDCFMIDCIKAL